MKFFEYKKYLGLPGLLQLMNDYIASMSPLIHDIWYLLAGEDNFNTRNTRNNNGNPVAPSPIADYTTYNNLLDIALSTVPKSHWGFVYEQSLLLFPDNVSLAISAANYELKYSNDSRAQTILTTALKYSPYSVLCWENALKLALKSGRVDHCIELTRKALEFNPLNVILWKHLVTLYHNSGDRNQIETIVNTARMIGVNTNLLKN